MTDMDAAVPAAGGAAPDGAADRLFAWRGGPGCLTVSGVIPGTEVSFGAE